MEVNVTINGKAFGEFVTRKGDPIQAAEGPVLVTVPNVPIVATGIEYALSSGPATFTTEDLRDAVASQDDPAIRSPRFKIGHVDPRYNGPEFDGTPAFGKFDNLRLVENDQLLVADLVGCPKWLADILPVAYPNRSIEGNMAVETVTGHTWRLVIWAVAALGVVWPGVATLEDLPLYYGDEMPDDVTIVPREEDDEVGNTVTAARQRPASVTAAVNVDDVRRQYYEGLDGSQMWWWIRGIYLEPNELIVDDDEGGLYRVPFEVEGEEITFNDPVSVKMTFVDASRGSTERRAVALVASVGREVASYDNRVAAGRQNPKQEEGSNVDPKQLRASIGLPEDASDEQVQARLAELNAAAATLTQPGTSESGDDPDTQTEPQAQSEEDGSEDESEDSPAAPTNVPEGMVLIDAATLADLQSGLQTARAIDAKAKAEDKSATISAAIKAGKVPPSRKEHYAAMWDKDPEGTKHLLTAPVEKGGLAAGLVPVVERGGDAPPDDVSAAGEQAYDPSWLAPNERARIDAVKAGSFQPATIHVEKGA